MYKTRNRANLLATFINNKMKARNKGATRWIKIAQRIIKYYSNQPSIKKKKCTKCMC